MLYSTEDEYIYVGKTMYEQIKIKGVGIVETQWKTKSGSIIDVLLSFAPLDATDMSKGLTFSATDMTDRNSRIRLEQELTVAVKSAEFKKNFLANMSHEMRTPLTGIIGMTEILGQTPLNSMQHDYLNTLRTSGENLMEIINQVLDFSKIEQGYVKLNYKDVAVKTLVKDAETLFHHLCDKEIEFSAELDPLLPRVIHIDGGRIQQVVHNLISNAVKFTPNGKVHLGLYLEKELEDGSCLIKLKVSDTGIGIAKDRQKDIFSPFMQVDDRDVREYEGVGLGLSIARQLIKLHGGDMFFESTQGEGSTFYSTFTARKASQLENAKGEPVAQEEAPDRLRVLFAEDKKVNQKVISLLLDSMGHEVTIAENGLDALELFKKSKFDLILIDIQMPVMDGVEAVKKLRENYKVLPPIVGLSANAFEGDREKYMAAGMDAYLTKPVKRSDMAAMLRSFF